MINKKTITLETLKDIDFDYNRVVRSLEKEKRMHTLALNEINDKIKDIKQKKKNLIKIAEIIGPLFKK